MSSSDKTDGEAAARFAHQHGHSSGHAQGGVVKLAIGAVVWRVQRHFCELGGLVATAWIVVLGAVHVQRQPSRLVAVPAHDVHGLSLALPGRHASWNVLVLSARVYAPTTALLLHVSPSYTLKTAVWPHLTVSHTGSCALQPSRCSVCWC